MNFREAINIGMDDTLERQLADLGDEAGITVSIRKLSGSDSFYILYRGAIFIYKRYYPYGAKFGVLTISRAWAEDNIQIFRDVMYAIGWQVHTDVRNGDMFFDDHRNGERLLAKLNHSVQISFHPDGRGHTLGTCEINVMESNYRYFSNNPQVIPHRP